MASTFDDDRTAAALALAADGDDQRAQAVLRQRRRMMIRTRVALVVGCAVVGAAIGIFLALHIGRPSPTVGAVAKDAVPAWRTAVGVALIVAGLLAEIVVIVVRIRSGEFEASWRSPWLILGRRQRRNVFAQIRGRRPVDPALLPVTRQLAVRLTRQRSMIGLWAALPIIFVGQALLSNRGLGWALAIAVLTLYGLVIALSLRDAARAARFLQQHPAPPPAAPAP